MGLNSYSQIINKLKEGKSISKGTITTKNGQTETFKRLTFKDKQFMYSDSKGNSLEEKSSEVLKVTKKGSYAGYGAAFGGLIALYVSLQVENQEQENIRKGLGSNSGRFPIYLGMAAGFTGVGALVGFLMKKDKTLYINMGDLSFTPSYLLSPNNNFTPMISLKINLHDNKLHLKN